MCILHRRRTTAMGAFTCHVTVIPQPAVINDQFCGFDLATTLLISHIKHAIAMHRGTRNNCYGAYAILYYGLLTYPKASALACQELVWLIASHHICFN